MKVRYKTEFELLYTYIKIINIQSNIISIKYSVTWDLIQFVIAVAKA